MNEDPIVQQLQTKSIKMKGLDSGTESSYENYKSSEKKVPIQIWALIDMVSTLNYNDCMLLFKEVERRKESYTFTRELFEYCCSILGGVYSDEVIISLEKMEHYHSNLVSRIEDPQKRKIIASHMYAIRQHMIQLSHFVR